MKLVDALGQLPEMSEKRLLELIKLYSPLLRASVIKSVEEEYGVGKMSGIPLEQAILKEWDKVQVKKSRLSRQERDDISGLVSLCLIKMTKDESGGTTPQA